MTDFPAATRALGWLQQDAIPLWLEHGLDHKRGGFFEALDLETRKNTAPFRRLRVTARQIYVFAAATRLNIPEARVGLEHGLNFLLGPARHPEWGFANRFDLDGQIIDPTRDLYDLAFVCFALAHAYEVTKDNSLQHEANVLMQDIVRHLEHPDGGFQEALPLRAPRRQNPHMHLLEACLAWSHLDPDTPFRQHAEALIKLFSGYFVQAQSAILPEYYSNTWAPLAKNGVIETEPGHHFEWVWLLSEAQKLGLETPASTAERLYHFAHEHGFDPTTGFPYASVSQDGVVLDQNVRLWAATEWTKAEVAMPVPNGALHAARIDKAWSVTERFLQAAPPGLWCERWVAQDMRFENAPAPASSLYHIVLAIEVMAAAAPKP